MPAGLHPANSLNHVAPDLGIPLDSLRSGSALGHRVVRADGVDQALKRLARRQPIDLMLTDLVMPGGRSGLDLARAATTARPGLPVILSSGFTGETLSAVTDAPWPLLRKPYSAEALARAIARALDPESQAA